VETSIKLPENKQKIAISGSDNTFSKIYLTPLIHETGAFWLCVGNDFEIKKSFDLLCWWYKQSNIELPSIVLWPTNAELSSHQFYQLHSSKHVVVITTAENLLSKTISVKDFNRKKISIKINDEINLSQIKQQLVANGYEVNTHADTVGLIAYRGFVLDIWSPQHSYPIRIELDNNKVVKINSINIKTKKKHKVLNSILALPMDISTKRKINLLSILNKSHSILINQSSLYKYPDIGNADFKHIIEIGPIHEVSSTVHLQNTNYFHNNPSGLKEYLNKHEATIITQSKQRISALLDDIKMNANIVEFKKFTFPGIEDKTYNNHFLTDTNLFKTEVVAVKTKAQNIYEGEIEIGDFVVHRDHGVAKFTSTIWQTIDNIEREYYLLEYKDGDKLYLPIDQIDRISKYLGVKNPKLHRLGAASTWPQVIRKVKEDIIKMAQQLLNLYARRELSDSTALHVFPEQEAKLAQDFPYVETKDQTTALFETLRDLEQNKPTDRLICGDVGFGKTEIAVRAAWRAVLNNQQVVLLCPTTILAQQHFDTFCERFKNYPVKISLLSRFVDTGKQKTNITEVANGKTDILIGTHRLLSKDIKYKQLGLIIIDEEQQFGVKDKEKLKDLKSSAHIITLSATPIPRTLNLSLSGVRDISIIATAPEGRLPIKTNLAKASDEIIMQAINNELKRNGQVYYLYNNVETINEQLKYLKKLLPKYSYGIVHGQLSSKEIATTMHQFDTGKIDILICSTIIANGLDLANVNTLIVTGSQNFGLAQLYQIRGRIGRSTRQAYAYFLYNSAKLKGKAAERLQALQEAEALGSGFQIATRDMEIRGMGNILGKKQHGKISLIGLTLYNELIHQTVAEIKSGIIPASLIDATIDLPINMGLPQDYLKSEKSRLHYYQLFANASTVEELNNHFKRLSKPWPQKVINLKGVSELRIACEHAGINLLEAKKIRNDNGIQTKIYLHFSDELDYAKVSQLLKLNSYWEFKDNILKINKNKLKSNWLLDIKNTIEFFDRENIDSQSGNK
jgi:transcription-repair coupling factor